MKKENKGITLIVLIITIIIVLIISGITIGSITSKKGIINQANDAKDLAEKESLIQKIEADLYNEKVKKGKTPNKQTLIDIIDSNGYAETINEDSFVTKDEEYTIRFEEILGWIAVVTAGETAIVNSEYTDGTDTAIIPKGFTVSSDANEQTIETGLVVKDSKENEWVWIPVDDVTEMYTTTGAPYTLCGTSGDTAVTASMASKSAILSGKTRTTPGTTSSPYYREPDLVVGSGTQYDYANYGTAGFTSLQDMAQNLVKDYEDMIASVRKYGGFYVGRYELTGSVDNPKEVSNTVLTNQNWYNLYKACKGFTTNEVESRMIWGCQWDAIMLWMLSSDDSTVRTYVTDSTGKGNYSGSKINTGSNSSYEVNKIFDLAGNCWEWTQEAYDAYLRAHRRRRLHRQWLWLSSFSPQQRLSGL